MSKESPTIKSPSSKEYRLDIPKEIGLRLRRCRASIRKAIQVRLANIAELETARPSSRSTRAPPVGPPLRFYSSESYRVSYRIDRELRKVVVLALRWEANG
jgi:hypothetical protein